MTLVGHLLAAEVAVSEYVVFGAVSLVNEVVVGSVCVSGHSSQYFRYLKDK
jgi:hypothetical protein